MSYYLWIFFNLIFVIITSVYIWLVQPYHSFIILSGKIIAQIAVFLFAINVNIFFIIQVIKKVRWRSVKTSLAKLLRRAMKIHIPIAIIGTSLIVVHAIIMILKEAGEIGYFHPKLIAGYIAMLALIINLFAGYLRHLRASGFRRKFHLTMALIFAVSFLVHIFIPI